jgi:capsid protein
VEKNKAGQVVAYHVANFYENEFDNTSTDRKFTRVPVFDEQGRRQIFHIMNGERIGQRRGMPVFAPVVDALKQMTRLADAELMNALVASYFTVFVKDMSGLGSLMQEGFTPSEVTTGGGGLGPNAVQEAKATGDEFDLEMGSGNVVYVDDKKDVTIADPRKVDGQFEKFFDALAMQVCAAANMPAEEALMKYQTSYTAAKAASNQAWKAYDVDRWKMDRRFCSICSNEVLREGVLKGRIQAPGYFDDASKVRAWGRAWWVGTGQGQLNPKDEAQAAVIKVNNKLSTREEEYMMDRGGRWDSAMERYARENKKLDDLGIVDNQNSPELVGADGQSEESEGQSNETNE